VKLLVIDSFQRSATWTELCDRGQSISIEVSLAVSCNSLSRIPPMPLLVKRIDRADRCLDMLRD
jgi:hypothetical protein